MKKIFTLIAAAITMFTAQAKDYEGTLSVTIDGVPATPQKSVISLEENADGTYNLSLKNFFLNLGTSTMPVGTINLTNVNKMFTQEDGAYLNTKQDIQIENGDAEGVTQWLGPGLGDVPVGMIGQIEDDLFRAHLTINFLDMDIRVQFADGMQLPNSGFENYHDISDYDTQEADGWHMFYSATGKWYTLSANMFSGRTNYSTDVRPGSTGSKSLLLTSNEIKLLGIVANGTATTGRLNVDATSTDVTQNYSFSNSSLTDVDANGDPFYAPIYGRPDSLAVWVKFKQSTPQEVYKYASVSAVLTNGKEYRDPENSTYSGNVVAKAVNKTIESNGAEWQRISIPFDYSTYASLNNEPLNMLVTISTNAEAGKGSTDSLYVDDIELIYDAELASLSYDGQPIELDPEKFLYTLNLTEAYDVNKLVAVCNNPGARVVITTDDQFNPETGNRLVGVDVFSNDLSTVDGYILEIVEPTGINSTEASSTTDKAIIFNAAGQRIGSSAKGLNIIRQNGKAVKVLKK